MPIPTVIDNWCKAVENPYRSALSPYDANLAQIGYRPAFALNACSYKEYDEADASLLSEEREDHPAGKRVFCIWKSATNDSVCFHVLKKTSASTYETEYSRERPASY